MSPAEHHEAAERWTVRAEVLFDQHDEENLTATIAAVAIAQAHVAIARVRRVRDLGVCVGVALILGALLVALWAVAR